MVYNQLRDEIGEGQMLIEQVRTKIGFFKVTLLDPLLQERLSGRSLLVDYPETEQGTHDDEESPIYSHQREEMEQPLVDKN